MKIKMNIIRFLAVVPKACKKPYIQVDSLGFKANVGEFIQVFNRKAFRIYFDQNGQIQNPTDLVSMTLQDTQTRNVYFDNFTVKTLAEHPKVQSFIQDYLRNIHWDQAEAAADKTNKQLASSLPVLEIDLLFEEIYEMHRQYAIDRALDNQDKNTFMQLTRGEVSAI